MCMTVTDGGKGCVCRGGGGGECGDGHGVCGLLALQFGNIGLTCNLRERKSFCFSFSFLFVCLLFSFFIYSVFFFFFFFFFFFSRCTCVSVCARLCYVGRLPHSVRHQRGFPVYVWSALQMKAPSPSSSSKS